MAWTQTLLLVDGHAYAYRSFHAIRGLTSPTGLPTNAIYGFIKTIHKLRADLRPTHLAVVWDGGLAAERMDLLPQYKANRPPMPADLEAQMDGMVAWLDASGIASVREDDVEADDRIASLARGAARGGFGVVIASSDKDFMQLVSPQICLFNPNDPRGKLWTSDEVRAKAGVSPDQIVDWLSLIGDTVDNIPGVPGVGPKTSTALLQRFGSCDQLYDQLVQVDSDKLRESLRQSVAAVRRNQQMIRLKDDLPPTAPLEDLQPRAQQVERLRDLYGQWGFRSLLETIGGSAGMKQGDLFA